MGYLPSASLLAGRQSKALFNFVQLPFLEGFGSEGLLTRPFSVFSWLILFLATWRGSKEVTLLLTLLGAL